MGCAAAATRSLGTGRDGGTPAGSRGRAGPARPEGFQRPRRWNPSRLCSQPSVIWRAVTEPLESVGPVTVIFWPDLRSLTFSELCTGVLSWALTVTCLPSEVVIVIVLPLTELIVPVVAFRPKR